MFAKLTAGDSAVSSIAICVTLAIVELLNRKLPAFGSAIVVVES